MYCLTWQAVLNVYLQLPKHNILYAQQHPRNAMSKSKMILKEQQMFEICTCDLELCFMSYNTLMVNDYWY